MAEYRCAYLQSRNRDATQRTDVDMGDGGREGRVSLESGVDIDTLVFV